MAGPFFRYDQETGDIDDLPCSNVGATFKDKADGARVSFRLDGVTHIYHIPGKDWYRYETVRKFGTWAYE